VLFIFKGLAAHNQRIDRAHERLGPEILTVRDNRIGLIEPVERAVFSGNVAIKTGRSLNGYFYIRELHRCFTVTPLLD
jgi:hypothetical protein